MWSSLICVLHPGFDSEAALSGTSAQASRNVDSSLHVFPGFEGVQDPNSQFAAAGSTASPNLILMRRRGTYISMYSSAKIVIFMRRSAIF
jgi:hypothetical protein